MVKPDFQLNLIEVTLSADQFSASVLPFETQDQLGMLRTNHRSTHVFQRKGSNIICVPLTSNAPLLGDSCILNTTKEPYLVCKLIREAIIQLLSKINLTFANFEPPSFISRRRDLLAVAAGNVNAVKINCAHVYPRYVLAPKPLFPQTGVPLFGIQVDIGTQNELDCSVARLIELGLNPVGLYVRTKRQSDLPVNPLRDPKTNLRLVGRVYQVANNQLLLEDAPDLNELRADKAWLEANFENLETYLHLSKVLDVNGILTRLKKVTFETTGARGRLERINQQAAWLQKQGNISIASDLSCIVGQPLMPHKGINGENYRQYPPPEFVFNPAGSKTHHTSNRGLEEFGPFDNESFTTKRPNIAVVTPEAFQGDVEIFLRKFIDGVPKSSVFVKGFVRQYLLNGCKFAFATFQPDTHEAISYRNACLRVLQTEPKPDLVFVIIQDRHKLLHDDEDPYLVSKSVFLSQGVPVQEIEIETIRVPPLLLSGIPYKLNNIGLACYAKLGGIPFVMAAVHGLAQELVIGIGSATLRNGRLSGEERVVGITTVFSADGNYLLYNKSREVEYNDYPKELLATLRSVIEQIQRRNAWQPGDTIRLIFHVFKPLKDVEVQAVKQLVAQMIDFNVEFAFLHVSEDHGWIMFDHNNTGQYGRGEYIPDRGYALPLSSSEILLSVTGPRELKTPLQGVPHPLLLHLHRESTFKDLEYLAGQVFRFTALSWHSFSPSNKPVTILYSDRIATLLGKLRRIKNWNPDTLATSLRNSRWFL